MISLDQRKSEAGFTIQETLVVIMVSSLLVVLGLSAYSWTVGFFNSWNRKSNMKENVHSMLQRLAVDATSARRIVEFTDSTLVLDLGMGKQAAYSLVNGKVFRNEVLLSQDVGMQLKFSRVRSGQEDSQLKLKVGNFRDGAMLSYETTVFPRHYSRLEFERDDPTRHD